MGDRATFTLQLIDKVTGGARGASRSTDRLLGKFSGLERQSRSTGGAMTSAFGALDILKGNLLTAAVSKVTGLAVAAAGAAAEFITFGQNARLAFGQLAKHGADPEKLFEHSRALAVRFGLDVMDTTKQYQKFLALQFDPKQADDMIRMGADLQVLGSSAEDVKGVFLALGQIRSKGKFQAEEMMQLAERKISGALVTEEIGKALGGKTAAQVQQLQQSGKITADVAITAIENAVKRKLQETNLGDSGAKFADTTISGFINRVKALGQDAGITVVDKVTAPLTKLLGKGLDQIVGFLQSPAGTTFIDDLSKGLEKALGFATEFGGAFGTGFMSTLRTLGAALDPVLKALGGGDGKTTLATVRALGQALGQLAAFGIVVVAVAGGIAAGLTWLATAAFGVGEAVVLGLVAPLGKMLGDVVLWWDNLKAVWNAEGMSLGAKAWEIGKSIVLGLGRGILELASYPMDAMKGVAHGVLDALDKVIRPGSPSKATAIRGVQSGEGYAVGLLSTRSTIGNAVDRTFGVGSGALGPEASSLRAGTLFSGVQAGGGGGGGPMSLVINQNFDGSGNPEEVARLAAREARREIEAFHRQLEMEG